MKTIRSRTTVVLALLGTAISPALMHAQQSVTITGRVQSDVGQPLPGVAIVLRGMGIGAMSREDGRYDFILPGARATGQQGILEARRLGFRPETVTVALTPGTTVSRNFTLVANPLQLGEVVITGAGTATTAERLGTVRTSVDSTSIQRALEPNVVNALAAKAPGVEVTSQSGSPGSSSSIRIRGLNTIQTTGQPLFIVDGTPIDNTTFATSANTGSTDSPNRAADINPDDIASIEILKSAAAAAIYGARAGQGVVLITTKSGQAGENRWSFRTNVRYDELSHSIPLQRSFGHGSGGRPAVCAAEDCALTGSSFGPRLAEGTKTYDWSRDIYDNAWLQEYSGSVSGGRERTTFFLSGSLSNQQGITIGDNDSYNRITARLKATHEISSELLLEGNISYVDGSGQFIQKGSNTSGVNLGLWRSPPEFNNFNYIDSTTGLHRSYRFPRPSQGSATLSRIYDNPLFVINEQDNTQDVGRAFGSVGLTYTPLHWLDMRYNLGVDYVSDERLETLPQSSASFPGGQLIQGNIVQYQIDHNLVANFTRSGRPGWDTRFTLGANLNSRENHFVLVTGQNLIAPEPFNLENTTDYTTDDNLSLVRGESYFAQVQQALWDQLFVTATLRNDGFSTFGASDRRHWFPSATAAWTFSNLFNPGDVFTTARLRAAYGVTGTEPTVYLTDAFYSSGFLGGSYGDALIASQGGQGGLFTGVRREQNDLKPEKQYEFEGGLDLGVLNDRVDFGLTYYDRRNTDVIFDVPLPFSTGFSVIAENGGTIRNKGWEAQLNARPIHSAKWDWDIGLMYATNNSLVTELRGAEAVDLPTGGFFTGNLMSAVQGQPMPVFRSFDFARCRYNDAVNQVDLDGDGEVDDVNAACRAANAPNGAVYLGPDGFPIDDPALRVIGDPNPDWTGSLRTALRFGQFTFSGLVDVRQGGQIWNGTKGALYNFGTHKDTEIRGETRRIGETWIPGNPKGGKFEVFGPGKGKDVVIDQSWFQGLGSGFGPVATQFMEEASYVKLRELAIAYQFRNDMVRRSTGLGTIDLRLAGRNLHTWTNYTGVDPETNLGGAEVAALGIDYFNNPQTRSFVFTVTFSR